MTLLLLSTAAFAQDPAAAPAVAPDPTLPFQVSPCGPPEPHDVGAPDAAALARHAEYDPAVGWKVDGQWVPMVGRSELLPFLGVRTGPDGQPWLAGGQVTVSIDGNALGEGMRWPGLATRPVAGPTEGPVAPGRPPRR